MEMTDEPQGVGFVHAGLNVAARALVVVSQRACNRPAAVGVGLSLVAYVLSALSGWLGGELVSALGSGVSRTAFEPTTADFLPAADVALLRRAFASSTRIRNRVFAFGAL